MIFSMATLSPPSMHVPNLTHKLFLFHTAHSRITSLPFTPHQLHLFEPATFHARIPLVSVCHAKPSDAQEQELNEVVEEVDFDDGFERKVNYDYDDEEEGEEDTEGSIDLLIRFLGSMFKKVSRRVRKASRSVLPPAISPQLVSFAVDGVLLLASLSIIRALLEVVCSLGGTVFVAILLLRVFWSGVSYFQSSGNDSNQSGSSFGSPRPV